MFLRKIDGDVSKSGKNAVDNFHKLLFECQHHLDNSKRASLFHSLHCLCNNQS